MTFRFRVIALSTFLLGLGVTACSDNGGGSDTTNTTPDSGGSDSGSDSATHGTVSTGSDSEPTPSTDCTPNEPGGGGASGKWLRHVIADDLGPSIMFDFIPNLYGDGVLRAVGSNHTNTKDKPASPESQIVVFDIPGTAEAQKQPWPYKKISEGIASRKSPLASPQGAPGIFGYGDVDDDGDIDLVVSGDGDARGYFVLEQTAPGSFTTHVLASGMGQAGGMRVADFDKDGKQEFVVTSYEANKVQVYKWKHPAAVDTTTYGNNFDVYSVSGGAGPAFASVADVNADGNLDIVVSFFGSMTNLSMTGTLKLFLGSGKLDSWTEQTVVSSIRFPGRTSFADINGDGQLDLIVPSGFLACEANPLAGGACGSLAWYAQKSGTWEKHQIAGPKSVLFYHQAVLYDFDGDGNKDIITVGERRTTAQANTAKVQLFKGTGSGDYFETTPQELGDGLGSLPVGRNLDNDCDLDIFSAEYFLPTSQFSAFSFAWFEQVAKPE